jgi:hypothetical protein
MYLLRMRPAPEFRKSSVAALLFLAASWLASCVNEPEGTIHIPTAPGVTRTVPAHLGTVVALDQVITATFNVPMDPGSINTRTFVLLRGDETSVDTIPGAVAYAAGDTTATFTPVVDLLKCQLYTVILSGEALDSLCNVPVDTTWTFTTLSPVPVPPVLTAASPEKLEGNVALNAVVTATFNQPMDASSLSALTFTLTRAAGLGPVPVPATVSYDPGTRTATLTPNANLLQCQLYTVSIGASTPDSLCSVLAMDSTWSFNTNKLPVQPVITNTTPADLDGNVALDGVITATFNVPMDPGSLNASTFTVMRGFGNSAVPVPGTVSYDAVTRTATFTPDDSLVKCQPYTISLNAGSLDSICSRLEVDSTWSFTIPNKPVLMPAVQTTPVDLATDVAPNTAINAAFNVAMSPFSINAQTFVVVRETESGPDTVSGTVSYAPLNKTATFVPDDELLQNQLYKVHLSATMDSLCVQVDFDTSWSFTTADLPPPPVLEAVTNGVSISIAAHANPVLELYWFPSTGALTYHLQVSASPLFTTTVYDAPAVPHTNGIVMNAVPMTNLPVGTYYWRVNATHPGGTGDWSSAWTFTMTP